jgi:hypothetical protein
MKYLVKNVKEIGFPEKVCLSINTAIDLAVKTKEKQDLDFMLTINNIEEWFRFDITVRDSIKNRLSDPLLYPELLP